MTGRYEHNIDAKGRLFIPARIRDELGGSFHLAPGIDTCLAIYPKTTWDNLTERFAALPMSKTRHMRAFFANAVRCELDSQGRIVIPKTLLEYARLDKETIIVGVENRAEIWDKQRWSAENDDTMTPERMSALMEELGL